MDQPTSRADDDSEQLLASLLAAYDEALADGTPPPDYEDSFAGEEAADGAVLGEVVAGDAVAGDASAGDVVVGDGGDLAGRFRAAKECLELLNRVRRFDERHGADRTPAADKDVQAGDDEAADVDSAADNEPAADAPPARIGRFQIQRELGRGGRGVVYLAHDPRLGRDVAVKVPRADALAGSDARRRFLREAEAAARLAHHHIAALYEVGRDGATHYLVSEYCAGPTLADWLRDRGGPMPPRDAAILVHRLAEAVHHAHSRGVLHRDIKPSNVMVTRRQAVGDGSREEAGPQEAAPPRNRDARPDTGPDDDPLWPKLTDFGLAKLLEQDGGDTRSGAIIGTPAYMSPEQADGRTGEIDARTDVYGLGAVLYHVLTGGPPYQGATDVETLGQMLLDEPAAPRSRCAAVPRDLEAICLKCLAKHRDARYPTAQHLAEDLGRFLAGEPTTARPLGIAGKLGKWARRRPTAAALAIVVAASLLTLLVVAVGYSARLREEIARTEDALGRVERESESMRRLLYASDLRLAYEAYQADNVVEALKRLDRQIPQAGEEDLREFAWYYLRDLCDPDTIKLMGHKKEIYTVAFSHDGRTLATGAEDGTIRIWDAATGKVLRVIDAKTIEVDCVAFSPDDKLLAAGNLDHTIRFWDPATGKMLRELTGHKDHVLAVAFSPDGKQLASGSRDMTVRIWDMATGAVVRTLGGEMDVIRAVTYSPSGDVLFAADEAQRVHAWRTVDWERLPGASAPREKFFALAISGDGSRVAAAGRLRLISLWQSVHGDLRPADAPARLDGGHTDWIQSLAYSPVDDTLAAGGKDGMIKLWRPGESTPFRKLLGHTGRVWSIAWSPDGRWLASSSSDLTVRIWRIGPEADATFQPIEPPLYCSAFSNDSRVLYAGTAFGTVRCWNVAARSLQASPNFLDVYDIADEDDRVIGLQPSPDGLLLAVVTGDRTTRVVDRATFETIWELHRSGGTGFGLNWAHGRPLLATTIDDTTVVVVDASSWRIVRRLSHAESVRDLAFTDGGQHIVTISRPLQVWDVDSGVVLYSLADLSYNDVAVSADNRFIAASSGPVISLLDHANNHAVTRLVTKGLDVCRPVFHGSTLATGVTEPPIVYLWDARTGQQLLRLECDGVRLTSVAFSPDGSRLIATGVDAAGKGRIWEWAIRGRR